MKITSLLYCAIVFFALFQTNAMEDPKNEIVLKSVIIEFEGENNEITLTGESLAAFKNVCENSTLFKDLIPGIEKGFFKERNRVYLSNNISKDQFCILLSIFKNMSEYHGNYFLSGFQTKKIADLIKILEPLDFLQAPCYQDVMELIAYRLLDNPALAKKHLESLYNQDLVNTPTTIIFPDGSNIDFTSKKELVDLHSSRDIFSGNISTTTITISPKRILYYLKNLTKKNFLAKFGKVTDTENKKRLLIDYSPLKVEVLKKKLLKLSSCKMSCWIDTCIATESLLRNKLSTIVYKNIEMPLFNEHCFSDQFNIDNYEFAILDGHEIHIYKLVSECEWVALYNNIQKAESLTELLEILAKRA